MIIYIVNIILIVFWAIILLNRKSKIKIRLFLLITGIQQVLLSGLRASTVGTDTHGYLLTYENFVKYGIFDYSRLEIGFRLLMRVTSFISDNYQLILIITSLIIVYFIFKGVYNTSTNIWFSIYLFIALYFFYNSFNGIRQYMAISIIFYSFQFILKKEFRKYLIFTLIAMAFHSTAIITLPLYFLGKVDNNWKKVFGGIIVSMLIVVFSLDQIILLIVKLFPKYSGYLGSSYITESGGVMSSVMTGFFVLLGLFTMLTNKVNREFKIQFTIMIIAFVLSIKSMFGFIGLNRIAWYFTIFSILFIPNCINHIKNRKLRTIFYYTAIIITFAYNIYFLLNNQQRIIPYIINL